MKVKSVIIVLMLLLTSTVVIGQKTSPHFNPNFYEDYTINESYKPETDLFVLQNTDTLANIQFLVFDFNNKIVGLFNRNLEMLDTLTITEEDKAIFLSTDPMWMKYPGTSPYSYCGNNPVNRTDPTGMIWKDADGNKVEDHSKIKVYIFYDPKSFGGQSEQMYKDAEAQYGKGSVAMSDVTTAAEFNQDWGDMASTDIKEVNLNYHGSSRTINLDYTTNQYLTSTGNEQTPLGNPAMNIEDLAKPKGNVTNAQLNINSCHANGNPTENELNVAQAFIYTTNFKTVRATDDAVGYFNLFGPNRPHPKDSKFDWQYLTKHRYDLYLPVRKK